MELSQLLIGLLGKTLNMSEEQITSELYNEDEPDKLKENALDLLLAKDQERVNSFEKKRKDENQQQYDRGIRETSEKWEKDLRTKFGLSDTDKTGDELVALAVEKIGTGGGGDFTDEDVKKHPHRS